MTPGKADSAAPDTYMPPEHGWTCFHCGETFMHENPARNHFGGSIDAVPGCILRMQPGEHALLRKIRWLEAQNRELLQRQSEEDTKLHREIHRIKAEHETALRREEEQGFLRGLDAAKRYPETIGLRRAS